MNATHPADPKAIDEDVIRDIVTDLRLMHSSLLSRADEHTRRLLPDRAAYYTERARRIGVLADWIADGGLNYLDGAAAKATPAVPDAVALRAAVHHLNTPVTTSGAAS